MFDKKIVLITGGSSGIGMATAFLFAEQGADVVITYKNNKSGAEDVVGKIIKMGRQAMAIKANLIKERDAKRVVEKTIQAFGQIDVLVNNAGRYIEGDEWNLQSKTWLRSLQQNLVSVMSMSKYAAQIFIKQKSGVIINVASKHAIFGKADAVSYGAAKAGVINITQSYSQLLAPFSGRANSVSPSAANVGYWLTAPQEERDLLENELIEPRIIAEKIVFLASDQAKNINGQNFVIE